VLATVKSILTWAFVLTVCFIVIGFPLFVLVVAVGSLLAFALQAMMPVSAVFLQPQSEAESDLSKLDSVRLIADARTK
jgi:hypothetical protein